MWLNERKYDIVFLQETYSTVEVEDIWKTQWQGKLFFSHGTNRSCGVMALVRSDLDFKLNSVNADNEGRYLIIEAEVQSSAEAEGRLVNKHLIRSRANVILVGNVY